MDRIAEEAVSLPVESLQQPGREDAARVLRPVHLCDAEQRVGKYSGEQPAEEYAATVLVKGGSDGPTSDASHPEEPPGAPEIGSEDPLDGDSRQHGRDESDDEERHAEPGGYPQRARACEAVKRYDTHRGDEEHDEVLRSEGVGADLWVGDDR